MAVETFFIISGFYMSLILESRYKGKNSYKLFITNRFLRIYPIYWVILVMTIFASVMSGLLMGNWVRLSPYIQWHQNMGISALSFITISNLLIFGQDAVMFLGLNIKNGALFFTDNFTNTQPQFCKFLIIPQAWTLGLELVFYLIAPFILRKNIKFILWFISASLLVRFYIYFGLRWTNDPWTYRFLLTEIFFFLMGNVSYRIYGLINDNQVCRKLSGYLTVAFLLTVLFYKYIPDGGWLKQAIYYFFAAISLPFIFNLTKNDKKDSRIGDLSYPPMAWTGKF